MPKHGQTNPRGCGWDIRLTPSKQEGDHDESPIKQWLNSYCKKWAFQLERGEETKKFHWQIRLSSKTQVYQSQITTDFTSTFVSEGDSYYIRPTAKVNLGNQFYVIKEDTRVSGPWTDKDASTYIQSRFKDAICQPWQKKLINLVTKPPDDRHIYLVLDNGNEGKSWIKGYLRSHHDAIILPSILETPGQMMEFLCSNPRITEGGTYIILMDIPRANSPKHWWSLAQGLECIKQGFLYDHRHSCREIIIEPPMVCCFMNHAPPEGVMTKDVFVYFEKE